MNQNPELILSILTPAIPERWESLKALHAKVQAQIDRENGAVEHLMFVDNRRRSVGKKRDALLRMARGKYVAFVDDDDGISEDYIREILTASQQNPDVITFQQRAMIAGQVGTVEFKLGNVDEPFRADGLTKRNAWHVCPWRTTLAICSGFPDTNYGEDIAYAAPLCKTPGLKEAHIPKILHFYTYDAEVSRALPS